MAVGGWQALGQALVVGGGVPRSSGSGSGAFIVVWGCASSGGVLPLRGVSK